MIQALEKEFKELKEEDPRLAGEYAYVLAVSCHREGKTDKSRYYAQECLDIFNKLNIQTLEEAASRLNVVNGVCLPELIHERVVGERFKEMGIL